MGLSKTETFCKSASQEEIFDFFTKVSRALIKQKKIKDNAVSKLLNTKISNKKQHDSLYAKEFNASKMYNLYLEDLKILTKHLY